VDINTPNGHLIPFCLELDAANGGPWATCFDIPVVVPSSGAALRLDPADQEVSLTGGAFQVDVVVGNINYLGAFQFDLVYDPAVARVDSVDLGPFLGSTGCTVLEAGPIIDNVTGRLTYGGLVAGASCFFADVDCDEDVDIVDIYYVAYHWGCQCGDACYVPAYDLDDDCSISIGDIQIVACYFGWPNGDFSVCYAPNSNIEFSTHQSSTLRLVPEVAHVRPGESFAVALVVEEGQNLAGFEAVLHYDSQVLRFDDATLDGFLASTGNTAMPRETLVDASAGTVALGGFSFGANDSPAGSGTLVQLTFTAQDLGDSPLTLSDVQLARRCGLMQSPPAVVGGRVFSGWGLYLPILYR
jgi:hypothetical protein